MYFLIAFGLEFKRVSNGDVRIIKKEKNKVVMDVTIDEDTWAIILDDLREGGDIQDKCVLHGLELTHSFCEECMKEIYDMDPNPSIRPEIMRFAKAMELKMREHDPEKSDTWKESDSNYMDKKLLEEVMEYLLTQHGTLELARMSIDAISDAHVKYVNRKDYDYIFDKSKTKHPEELVDSGNVCMMLWNNTTQKGDKNEENKPI